MTKNLKILSSNRSLKDTKEDQYKQPIIFALIFIKSVKRVQHNAWQCLCIYRYIINSRNRLSFKKKIFFSSSNTM